LFKIVSCFKVIPVANAYIMLSICVRLAECRLLSRSRHANCSISVYGTRAHMQVQWETSNRFTRAYNFVSRRDETRRTGAGTVRDDLVKMNRKCWPESQPAVEDSLTRVEDVRDSSRVVREFDAKKYSKSNLPNN